MERRDETETLRKRTVRQDDRILLFDSSHWHLRKALIVRRSRVNHTRRKEMRNLLEVLPDTPTKT